jgi:acid phosphatase
MSRSVPRKVGIILGAFAVAVGLWACKLQTVAISPGSWDHVVVVWEENHDASEVRDLPYIGQLRAVGLTYTRCYGVARPSQPNYIAAFAGSTMGVADNLVHDLSGPNLYSRFFEAGYSMVSYADGLPSVGFRGASSGQYVRKHNPAASFAAVPDAAIKPFTDFPTDALGFAALPELSFVIPDLDHDMHDGTPAAADSWLQANLGAYATWARSNRSLLILTFDEPNTSWGLDLSHPILTVFVGEGLAAGSEDSRPIDLYRISDYLLESFGLTRLTP